MLTDSALARKQLGLVDCPLDIAVEWCDNVCRHFCIDLHLSAEGWEQPNKSEERTELWPENKDLTTILQVGDGRRDR
jgi:hypothetical protein